MSDFEAFQGDTVSLRYGVTPAQDMNNWDVRVVVKTSKSQTVPDLDLTLTQVSGDTFFKEGLMQTTSLDVGKYFLIAELFNPGSTERKEVHDTLKINEQGVF